LQLNNHINFIGEVPHNKVANYLQQANAFVLFSNHENFPCVLVEALCCGLPVVSSVVGGVADAITKENGMLVNAEDEEALTNAMMNVMTEYKNYDRAAIAANAKRLYDNEVIAQQFIDLYENVLK
jgi:glycosyltransferase involved in cell wall biosynthesis